MIVTGSFRVTTKDVDEKMVYAHLRRFLTENFRDYTMEVSGKKETLRHTEVEKIKIEEPKDKPTKQKEIENV